MQAAINQSVALVRRVAHTGFFEAVDTLACVTILESGNREEVGRAIDAGGAALAFERIQKALFQRVLIQVMTSFDPIRKGDFHLRVGLAALDDADVMAAVGAKGDSSKLQEAVDRFRALDRDDDAALGRLRHYRNKEAAHLSEFDPSIPRPLIGELISFAHNTASVAEALALGVGPNRLSLASQLGVPEKAAKAFWERWL